MGMAPAGAPGSLGVPQAVVLGAVEGVTEFLPVSSTAHLAVAERLLGVARGAEQRAVLDSYLVVVQGGAIVAVAWLYRRRLAAMVWTPGPGGRRTLAAVMVASAPAGVVGLAVGDVVKRRLFDPRPIALAWLVGGVASSWWRGASPDGRGVPWSRSAGAPPGWWGRRSAWRCGRGRAAAS